MGLQQIPQSPDCCSIIARNEPCETPYLRSLKNRIRSSAAARRKASGDSATFFAYAARFSIRRFARRASCSWGFSTFRRAYQARVVALCLTCCSAVSFRCVMNACAHKLRAVVVALLHDSCPCMPRLMPSCARGAPCAKRLHGSLARRCIRFDQVGRRGCARL